MAGKGKRGGQQIDEQSILCAIECHDGSVYRILAGVRGKEADGHSGRGLIENRIMVPFKEVVRQPRRTEIKIQACHDVIKIHAKFFLNNILKN